VADGRLFLTGTFQQLFFFIGEGLNSLLADFVQYLINTLLGNVGGALIRFGGGFIKKLLFDIRFSGWFFGIKQVFNMYTSNQ